jgi:hypothetical protein
MLVSIRRTPREVTNQEKEALTVPNSIALSFDIGHALHDSPSVIPEAQPRLVVTNMAKPCALLDQIMLAPVLVRKPGLKIGAHIALRMDLVAFDYWHS